MTNNLQNGQETSILPNVSDHSCRKMSWSLHFAKLSPVSIRNISWFLHRISCDFFSFNYCYGDQRRRFPCVHSMATVPWLDRRVVSYALYHVVAWPLVLLRAGHHSALSFIPFALQVSIEIRGIFENLLYRIVKK